jgi:hypothetical protein
MLPCATPRLTCHPALPLRSHHFEAAKAKQNERCLERQMAVPSGQRWQVQAVYREAVEQRIKREEAQLEQVGAVLWPGLLIPVDSGAAGADAAWCCRCGRARD